MTEAQRGRPSPSGDIALGSVPPGLAGDDRTGLPKAATTSHFRPSPTDTAKAPEGRRCGRPMAHWTRRESAQGGRRPRHRPSPIRRPARTAAEVTSRRVIGRGGPRHRGLRPAPPRARERRCRSRRGHRATTQHPAACPCCSSQPAHRPPEDRAVGYGWRGRSCRAADTPAVGDHIPAGRGLLKVHPRVASDRPGSCSGAGPPRQIRPPASLVAASSARSRTRWASFEIPVLPEGAP